jgi:hypothetical protein
VVALASTPLEQKRDQGSFANLGPALIDGSRRFKQRVILFWTARLELERLVNLQDEELTAFSVTADMSSSGESTEVMQSIHASMLRP